MAIEAKISRIERDVRSLALDYVQKTYGLLPGDLDKLAALRSALAGWNVTFADGLEIMWGELEGKTAEDFRRAAAEIEQNEQHNAKWERNVRLAGLDPEMLRIVGREMTMTFEPAEAETVTFETLLALDRRIYETALERSRQQQSLARVVQE
jgi:hypothetical protein